MSAHEIALHRIAKARATAAAVLDLGDLALDSLPEELGHLSALRVLALGKFVPYQENGELKWEYDFYRPVQRFTELDALKQLTGLQTLKLAHCPFLTNVDGLKELTGLQTLNLFGCGALTNVDGLKELTGLQTLDLAHCPFLTNVDGLKELTGLRTLDLSCASLANVDGLKELTGLQSLDLSECASLANVDVLKELTGLQTLKLAHCPFLTNVDVLKELTGLQTLSLVWCTSLANVDVLKELTGLQTLKLAHCPFLTNVDVLKELTGLQTLSLVWCTSLANVDGLKELTGLRTLDLSGTSLANVDVLKELTGLQSLDLTQCASLANVDGLKELTGLQTLKLAHCPFLTNVDVLKELTGLRTLRLAECTFLTNVDVLKKLTGLRTLDLSECASLANVDGLKELTGLWTLDLSECASLANVDGLKELTGLRTLDLSECASLANVDGLKELPGLQSLDLSGCRGIPKFAPLRRLLPQLNRLILYQCHFQDLPAEVCGESVNENVLEAVRAHFAEGDVHGWHADEELKVFVLGNGGVGKTQLCRRLRDLPYDPSEPTTHGVQLEHIDISLPGRSMPVRLNLWDFGGQDIYHASHSLFLQGPAVFVILWTKNTEDGEYKEAGVRMRHRPLAYWLDYVHSIAGTDSPMLIVQGKCDSDEDECPLPGPLPKGFFSPRCLVFSAKQDMEEKKLKGVRDALQEAAAAVLDRHKAPDIPQGRIRLARQLRQMLEDDNKRPAENRRRLLTQKRFQVLCKKNGQINMRVWREALRFLHFRGVLFWRPDLFKGRIILDQSWALEAIYALFHHAKTLPTSFGRGRFARDIVKALIWQDRTDAEQRTFLGMMESCGICFRARRVNPGHYPVEWEYIAPELLPVRTSPEVQHQLINLREDPASARADVRFLFLHEGVLRRLLSWLGHHVGDQAVYWRFGCWFHDQTTRVHVIIDSSWDNDRQHPGQGVITFDAWGEQSVPLLETLIAQVKMLSPLQEPEIDRTGFEASGYCSVLDTAAKPNVIVEARSELGAFGPFHPLLARKRKDSLQQILHLAELVRDWPTEQAEVPDVCRALPPEKRRDNGPKEIANHFKALENLCGPLSKTVKDGLAKRLLPKAQILDRLAAGIAEIQKALAWHSWRSS